MSIPLSTPFTPGLKIRKTGPNDFQDGIEEVRRSMKHLIGNVITVNTKEAFTEKWAGHASGVVDCVVHDGRYVAGVRFEGEGVSKLTSASFMLRSTTWEWSADRRDDSTPTPLGIKHERSMHRAYQLATVIVGRVGAANLKDKCIVILDGNGENRRAIEMAFEHMGIPVEWRPTVITLELNPDVALASALRFGRKHVRLTSGDPRIQSKQKEVCGIERAMLTEHHDVLTAREKDSCVGLYLDYCGSPSKLTDFDALYKRLPQLSACAVTVAKRQGADLTCDQRRTKARPPVCSFELLATYDHDKVFCDMYARPLDSGTYEQQLREAAVARATVFARDMEKRAVHRCNVQNTRKDRSAIKKNRALDEIATTRRLVGTFVGIPLDHWPGGQPGDDFDAVQRRQGKLLFQISGSFRKSKCELRALMKDGTLHPATERFWLTPTDAAHFSLPRHEMQGVRHP